MITIFEKVEKFEVNVGNYGQYLIDSRSVTVTFSL